MDTIKDEVAEMEGVILSRKPTQDIGSSSWSTVDSHLNYTADAAAALPNPASNNLMTTPSESAVDYAIAADRVNDNAPLQIYAKRARSPRREFPKKRVKTETAAPKRIRRTENARTPRINIGSHASIYYIKMPSFCHPRLPSEEPNPTRLPWAHLNYANTMVVHWRDEKQYPFVKVRALYNQKFGTDITEEAVRRRHYRACRKLATIYGLTEEGKASVVQSLNEKAVYDGDATDTAGVDDAGDDDAVDDIADENETATVAPKLVVPRPPRIKTGFGGQKIVNRDLAKRKIVELRVEERMSWDDIRDKIQEDFGWSLGSPTVTKYYDSMRAVMRKEQEIAEKLGDAEPYAETLTQTKAKASCTEGRCC